MPFQVILPDGLVLEGVADTYPKVMDLEGWDALPTPDAVLVANGGGPGAVAVGGWEPNEQPYVLTAVFAAATRTDHRTWRKRLAGNFPPSAEVSLRVVEDDQTRQVFVRRYDEADVAYDATARMTRATVPLLAPDPYKYRLTPLTGTMGVFTGDTWFRTYALVAGKWSRTYALVAGKWSRTYGKAVPMGPYPTALTLTSSGDATSQRLTATVNGPLTAGDWWLVNETTGARLWVAVSVLAGQSLVLDMRAKTARLNGAPVDHQVFGDWLTLAPGQNVFRLASGTASAAYAYIEALEADQ